MSRTGLVERFKMDKISLISTRMDRMMSAIVGYDSDVRMRRMIINIVQELKNVEYKFYPMKNNVDAFYISGSHAEGLRFSSSDVDYMFIFRKTRVIFDIRQLSLCKNTTLLQAKCTTVTPGFALLKLATKLNTTIPEITDTFVKCPDGYYVSSAMWRNLFTSGLESERIHGPCHSSTFEEQEYDQVTCLKSDSWPKAANGCIKRLRAAGGPFNEAISSIIKDGCLFVPIGSKNSPQEELEWRLSFSLAEKTLIHNLTHSQLLTYALLKAFLKEAIDGNQEVKGLLCSYFLKTVVLWKVTGQTEDWNKTNFLQNFWRCFQTLITYVISGYCPNFFIPENNMFKGKIEGVAQRNLCCHLTSLYREGFHCLLRCPSLKDLFFIFHKPPVALISMSLSDQAMLQKPHTDINIMFEIWTRMTYFPLNNQRVILAQIMYMRSILHSCSPDATVVVKTWIKILLLNLCVMRAKKSNKLSNKLRYTAKQTINKVCMSSKCDATLHLLYLSLALYHLGVFSAMVQVLSEVKRRIHQPYHMYIWNPDKSKYRAAGGDSMPIIKMMKTVVTFPVMTELSTCIPGLELEHEASTGSSGGFILLPPAVLTKFLLFLCYKNESNTEAANAERDELSTLLHCQDGDHIRRFDRPISWQLLGICREISGDYLGAYISYNAAMHHRWCSFRSASKRRISRMLNFLHGFC